MIPKTLTGYNVPWELGEKLWINPLIVSSSTDESEQGEMRVCSGMLAASRRCTCHEPVINGFSPGERPTPRYCGLPGFWAIALFGLPSQQGQQLDRRVTFLGHAE
jgi:hypothetical protein